MKPIKDFEDYSIDDEGNVWSNKYGRLKKLTTHQNVRGHHRVSISLNGYKYTLDVHRLVYIHFVGNIPDMMDVYHLDGNKTNNRVDNLILKPHGRKKKQPAAASSNNISV